LEYKAVRLLYGTSHSSPFHLYRFDFWPSHHHRIEKIIGGSSITFSPDAMSPMMT